jgi:hypothetical protein
MIGEDDEEENMNPDYGEEGEEEEENLNPDYGDEGGEEEMLEEGECGEYGGEDELDEGVYSEEGEMKNRDYLNKELMNELLEGKKEVKENEDDGNTTQNEGGSQVDSTEGNIEN